MANDISTIQSLKAVDAWIDVINANINGGVRTAFKASRLRFAGSNTQLDRAPTTSSLPLQFPEPGLITANTVIDFSQGAITSSTETSHLAIQGDGFFLLADPATIDPLTGLTRSNTQARFLLTRDGEFHTDANGLLVNSAGYFLVTSGLAAGPGHPVLFYNTGTAFGGNGAVRAIFNDLDSPTDTTTAPRAINLSTFLASNGGSPATYITRDRANLGLGAVPLMQIASGQQNLRYTSFGSTVFDFGFQAGATFLDNKIDPAIRLGDATGTVLSKSLEASNSSMTQSVPELSLAQKLFSALTKVLQIGQTNTDSVLNLVR